MSRANVIGQPHEAIDIQGLISVLSDTLGDNLLAIWLFGSKARGDDTPDSDVDLLIVVGHLEPPIRWRIREAAADCSLEHDLLINTHIIDRRRWAEHALYASTLWREIKRDGVLLYS